jgi:DNA-binding beta-propeller fold protein YncE
MTTLLITGGILRPNGFELGEGKYYGEAVLLKLDLESGSTQKCISITEGNANFPKAHPNLEFTAGSQEPNTLWLSTDTEIRHYQYPSLTLLDTFSHPCFHNIHSVAVYGERLYVTSTGLDLVAILNKHNGKIEQLINAEGKPTWHRFDQNTDYRKKHSTRPHDCHPNYIFWLHGEPWVTRCTQEDAVCLTDFNKRIAIHENDWDLSVHDGIVRGNEVLFSTVDGCIVVVDTDTYKIKEIIKLYQLPGYGHIRGWCRGLYLQGNLLYIGFSRLRKTKGQGKLAWLSQLSILGTPSKNASILVYDLENRTIIKDYPIPQGDIDAIYTILPEPKQS